MLYEATKRAKQVGVPCTISIEDIDAVWPQDGVCPILNMPMAISDGPNKDLSPSLDRIVPDIGYVRGNIAVISKLANAMKQRETNPAVFRRLAEWLEKQLQTNEIDKHGRKVRLAMANWLTKLQKMEGVVLGDYDPNKFVLRSPSPSFNFIFGNGHGLPQGFTMVLGGIPKAGKSVILNSMIGQLHKDDPDAIAIKFDTEFRESGQLTEEQANLWGIDRKRYVCYQANAATTVFDRIEQEIAALCQEGMPLKLIAIDSINALMGLRSQNAEGLEQQINQFGDLARALPEAFKRIVSMQRKYRIGLILTCHVRAELDPLEQKRGNKTRLALPFGAAHFAEYFVSVEPNRNKDAKTDLSGKEFRDESLGDIADNAEQTGHKIRAKMMNASMGPKGRVAEFTLDYHKGIVNTHEEVFLLGKNRGIITMPNQLSYEFGGKKWVGKQGMLDALANDRVLYDAVLAEVYRRDTNHNEADDAQAA